MFGLILNSVHFDDSAINIFLYVVLIIISIIIVVTVFAISRQPIDPIKLAFKVIFFLIDKFKNKSFFFLIN